MPYWLGGLPPGSPNKRSYEYEARNVVSESGQGDLNVWPGHRFSWTVGILFRFGSGMPPAQYFFG